ncbi:MAG: ATP-binding protein [Bacteroidaceae bacterium]|nr:ATP-binding protein [Bacteroidaceae bacterium]
MDIQGLISNYAMLLSYAKTDFVRYLYKQIDWSNRLIVIKGAKGVGKTTMIFQRIKLAFPDPSKALYVSLDNLWFASNTLLDLADYFYKHGGTHLFLDEVHKYPNWVREVKNIYDMMPHLHIIVTGSSILSLTNTVIADLSRRHREYTLVGMSFREFLSMEGAGDFPTYSLDDVTANHFVIASDICSKIKVLPLFEKYLSCGYYPFYRDDPTGFNLRLQQVVNATIESEIPTLGHLEYETVYKAKRLLGALSQSTPYTLNLAQLSRALSVSRNNLLKLLHLLEEATLLRRLYAKEDTLATLGKPEKVLFDNANIMNALSGNADKGTLRETFFASQLTQGFSIYMPQKGDFLTNTGLLFEVGGKGKKFTQIKDETLSFVVQDDVEIGFGNKIPLWLFGMLY